MLWNTILLALREIRRNVMRSVLTILGIVIGVGAVITMVTIGGGATVQVRAADCKHGQQPAHGQSGEETWSGPVFRHRSVQGERCRGHCQGRQLDCCRGSGLVPVHQGHIRQPKLVDPGNRKRQSVFQGDEQVHQVGPAIQRQRAA